MSPSRSDRQPRLMEVLPQLSEPQHRRADPSGQHVEGDQFADASATAFDDQLRAEIKNRRGHEFVDELDQLARGIAETEDAEARRHVSRESAPPIVAASAARPPSP